jgi:hypothetical protein
MRASQAYEAGARLRVAPSPTAESPVVQPAEAPPAGVRRTVRIQGRGADPFRSAPSVRSRSAYSASPLARRVGASPDRLAMWAMLLGFVLVIVASLSSHF